MLALAADTGDVAVRTDVSKTFILASEPATTLGNWQELLTSDAVVSVDGQTGIVDLSASYVNVSGDTMTGALAMGTNKITGLGTPTNSASFLFFSAKSFWCVSYATTSFLLFRSTSFTAIQ